MNKTIKEILNSHFSTADKMNLIDQYRKEESKAKDCVYEFFRGCLKDNQELMDFARHHYERYLKNDPDYPTFESWFKGCVYDMSGNCWKDGVNDWLGQLKYQGKFDQFLTDVKFQDFLDNMDYKCQVTFHYSDGRCPGSIWGMMIDPNVQIGVELTDF